VDTTEIRATYQALEAAAAAGAFQPRDASEWPTEKIIAHAIATNQTLNRLGIELLDGEETSYEGGTLSVRDAWLDAIVEGAGDFDGLIAYLRHSYSELLALASRFDDEAANRKFHGRIFDGITDMRFGREKDSVGVVGADRLQPASVIVCVDGKKLLDRRLQ
jgi:hypothetical protein